MVTASEFEEKVGYPPQHDDLERCNCEEAGTVGHLQCGWCKKHDKPRFVCACLPPKFSFLMPKPDFDLPIK